MCHRTVFTLKLLADDVSTTSKKPSPEVLKMRNPSKPFSFNQKRVHKIFWVSASLYSLIEKLLISKLLTDSILCCSHDHLPSSWQKDHEHARWTWVQHALLATLHMRNFVRVTAGCLTQENLWGWCNIRHGWYSFPQYQKTERLLTKPVQSHLWFTPMVTDVQFAPMKETS